MANHSTAQMLVSLTHRWGSRLLSIASRVILPLLLSWLLFRYLVVHPLLARDPLSRFLGLLGHAYPIAFVTVCSVVLMGLFDFTWRAIGAQRRSLTVQTGLTMVPGPRSSRFWSIAATVLAALAAAAVAIVLRVHAFESHRVLSTSMLPSLTVGDEVLVNKLAGGWRQAIGIDSNADTIARRGKAVVFNFIDEDGSRKLLLKRVIGIAGDRIKMKGNTPVINGWTVPFCDVGPYANLVERQFVIGRLAVEFLGDESYLTLHTVATREPFSEEYLVKPGEAFVLGDHRSESIDSRAWNQGKGGGVPLGAIEGRVDRFLFGARRSGSLDFSRLLHSPDAELNIEGVDVSELSANIRKCVANRPRDPHPPSAPGVALASRQ